MGGTAEGEKKRVLQGEEDLKRRMDKFEKEAKTVRRRNFGTLNNGCMEIDSEEAEESKAFDPPHLEKTGPVRKMSSSRPTYLSPMYTFHFAPTLYCKASGAYCIYLY